jgi:methyl-accepting chemotaxis protein
MLAWFSRDRAGWVSALPLSLVVVVGALLSLRSHYLLRHDRELVVHSFEVIRAADQVLIGSLDAETGQRGFVITGEQAFLAPYEHAANEAIPAALAQLKNLVGDNAQQLALIQTLKQITEPKLEEMKLTVATRRLQGFAAAQSLVAERTGKDAMDRIRAVTQQIEYSEQQLLTARSTEVWHDEQRIIVIITLTTVFSTLLRVVIATLRQRAENAKITTAQPE